MIPLLMNMILHASYNSCFQNKSLLKINPFKKKQPMVGKELGVSHVIIDGLAWSERE